ncbi:ARM repeat-containing protein [Fomitiporia mediterranea MF3/22]|uniref:ARM repeat-containing protein n=1 Tax=Fomitiporia mediterranea (strain MF3/22) TaxID=694068 RepID=UPI0004408EC9|nr:ARM repeat-containing protein [Fomitiporia mediterranea MF3/22]EJD06563.1 ARM repeat-containing protein [Fomitiporia mediterranea MF3/22]
MDDIEQISQAILVASDPTQTGLHQQALEFAQDRLKSSAEPWKIGLSLFIDTNSDGTRKHQPQVRFYGLRILEDFLDSRFDPLPSDAFDTLRQALMAYVQSEYAQGSAESGAPYIRNKFSHTLTLFFLCTYLEQWPSFFTDFFGLIQSPSNSGIPTYNPHVSLLLFHLVLEISGEVADQMLKAARQHNNQRHFRDSRVRDAVRERDAGRINEAVLTIVANSAEQLTNLRKGASGGSVERLTEVVDWGVRTFGSYVGWIDINLTVTPTTIALLFTLLSDPSLPIRLATSVALLRMVAKGLKEPGDKIQLFRVLSLGQVLEALEDKTRQEQIARGEDTDEGEESYREALGRLLNAYGLELVKLADDNNASDDVKAEALSMLSDLRPTMLHFLADPYDDTTSTVFPLLSSILGSLKKVKRSSPHEITDDIRAFLASTLTTLLQKMKWDEDEDLDDMDADDKHAFEHLRKGDLRVHLDSIVVIDQDMAIEAIRKLVLDTLAAYETGSQLKWNDAELAIYLIYIFGEINKSGGKGRAAFCQAPAVARELRKGTDYSEYPLTPHGEMLMALVRSNICVYPNNAVSMQFFETCARYGDFFKVRKECIMPMLEAMIGPRGIHHPDTAARSRMFYLFYKFIKEERSDIPLDIVATLLNGMRDLLSINVEIPELENPAEQDLLTETIANSNAFESQINLFEAVGQLVSLFFKNIDETAAQLLSFVQPLLDELEANLQAVKGAQDVVPIVKIHHVMMALGSIAKGFPEVPQPIPEGYLLPPISVFRQMTQAIVVSLGAMSGFKPVRDAARFAFARMVATTGSHITDFIPAMMSSLLSHFEPTEIVDFMNFLTLLMHRLGVEMSDVLNQLVVPLHTRIMELLAIPITGTDDRLTHGETKRAYLNFLNNIMTNKLYPVLISDANKSHLVPLLESVIQIAEDVSDPAAQKLSFSFLGRCVSVWGQLHPVNGDAAQASQTLPGFEAFIYDRLVPLAIRVPLSPAFNIKDGQMLVVSHEIANFLQIIAKARGEEGYQFFVTVFLPSQGCPPDTAIDFGTKLRDLDTKGFRKYFTDFIRASRPGS